MSMFALPSFEDYDRVLRLIYAAIESAGLRLEDYVDPEQGVRYNIVRGVGESAEFACKGLTIEEVRLYIVEKKLDRHNDFLDFILEIIDAAGKRKEFDQGKEFHLKVSHPAHNPLDIQAIPEKYPYMGEKRRILIAHLMKVEHSTLPIPNVILTDLGHIIELQSVNGYFKVMSQGLSGFTTTDQTQLVAAKVILQVWKEKLQEQGWIAIAQSRSE